MSETDYNRQPVRIIELEQPRCSLRFGTSPCTATGTPLCYNTFWTCKDRDNYTPDGFIRWRFYDGRNGDQFLYEEFANENEIGTNAFPVLLSASTSPSRINVGGQKDNESPFGVMSKLTVKISEFEFDDHVGDFYVNNVDRDASTAGWVAKFIARNRFYPNMILRDYRGYVGEALADMQVSEYVLDNIEQDGPKSATLTGRDPLDLATDKKAQFPRPSDIQLAQKISATTETFSVSCAETELSADYGNTGDTRYMRLGSEVISYTGWTGTEPDFTLTGVTRGVLNTTADGHEDEDSGQRVGRYENISMYKVAEDLLDNHTQIPSRFFQFSQWDTEGETYLSTLKTTATVAEPTSVEKLCAELSRDGLFYIWWDARTQKIPMRAVRPPSETPVEWSDDLNIIQDSFSEKAKSDDRLTRVALFYGQRDPTETLNEFSNYRVQRLRIDTEVEQEDATGGEVIERKIFSRWINTDNNALLVAASLVLRYKYIPRYLTLRVDAKDRAIDIADVVDISTRHKIDSEGNREATRYQVISLEEIEPGETVSVDLQTYLFIGKFAIIMENDAPVYADATEAEREDGCWLADETTGLMPDGTQPYLLQ